MAVLQLPLWLKGGDQDKDNFWRFLQSNVQMMYSETSETFPLNLVIRKGRYSLCMVIGCWPEITYSNFIFFSTEKKYDFVKEIILESHAFIKRHISNPST